MLGLGLLLLMGELAPERRLVLLLDCPCGKLLESLCHHIHITPFEEYDVARRLFRSVLLERIVNPVFVGGALEGLDISVGHFNVADGGILSHEMLDGLLAPVGLRLRGGFLSLLNFLHELLESFVQHLSSDFAALDGDSNNFGIYFILHGNLLSKNRESSSTLRWYSPIKNDCHV